MPIANAEVRLVGKDATANAFRSAVRNAETASAQIGSKFRAAFNFLGAGAAVYAFTRAISGAIKAGDDLQKFAQKSGLAAEAASELAHAAKMADLDLGSLATGVKHMQVTLSEAGSGTQKATDLLKSLGLTFKEIKDQSPDRQLELFAEQISRLKDPADRTRAAVELFGRAGADLLPLFEKGAAGIRAARQEAIQMGQSFSAADLARFQEADKSIKTMKTSVDALASSFALLLGPVISRTANELALFTGKAPQILKLRQELEALQDPANKMTGSLGVEEVEKRIRAIQIKIDRMRTGGGTGIRGGRGMGAVTSTDIPPGFAWLANVERQAKLTAAELEALERFQNQGVQIRIDASRLSQPLAAGADNQQVADEVNAAMQRIRDTTLELPPAFVEANDSAKDMMTTLKDEAARRGLSAISDLIYGLDGGAKNFAKSMIDAFRRILADEAARKLFELLKGAGSGGSGGGSGWLGAIASGIGALFSGGFHFPGSTPTVPSSGGGGGGGFSGALAAGGYVKPGGWGIVGEAGPELAFGGAAGQTIVPFGRMGRESAAPRVTNINISPVYNTDARGATTDLVKALPVILQENNRRLFEALRDLRSRGQF